MKLLKVLKQNIKYRDEKMNVMNTRSCTNNINNAQQKNIIIPPRTGCFFFGFNGKIEHNKVN